MTITLLLAAFPAILTGLAGVLVLSRLKIMGAAPIRAAHIVDVARYEPMRRLLSKQDLELVAADRNLTRILKTQRARLFRDYLRCLTKDFGSLLAGVRQLMVDSPEDRPDLASLLIRSKVNFTLALLSIEFRLVAYRLGVAQPDMSGLVAQLRELRAIQLPPHAALAA